MTSSLDSLPPIVAIAGPTAAGKSALALALCGRLEGAAELVSVDSAQIYRGMDIGSAKPDAATRAAVPHHLIDILDPAEAYSAARFADDAAAAIAAIRNRGRVPVLVGGTFLYFRALFEGLHALPSADPGLRAQLEAERAADGADAQHRRLAALDPITAARLHPNDAQRVVRALEIMLLSGKPASAWHAEAKQPPALPGRVLRVALAPPDKADHDRQIRQRFEQMIADGFVDEVRRLRSRGDLSADLPAMRAVGYRQIWEHLDGAFPLDEAIRRGTIATRQYAKRQMNWLRGDAVWQWLPAPASAALPALVSRLGTQRQASGSTVFRC